MSQYAVDLLNSVGGDRADAGQPQCKVGQLCNGRCIPKGASCGGKKLSSGAGGGGGGGFKRGIAAGVAGTIGSSIAVQAAGTHMVMNHLKKNDPELYNNVVEYRKNPKAYAAKMGGDRADAGQPKCKTGQLCNGRCIPKDAECGGKKKKLASGAGGRGASVGSAAVGIAAGAALAGGAGAAYYFRKPIAEAVGKGAEKTAQGIEKGSEKVAGASMKAGNKLAAASAKGGLKGASMSQKAGAAINKAGTATMEKGTEFSKKAGIKGVELGEKAGEKGAELSKKAGAAGAKFARKVSGLAAKVK